MGCFTRCLRAARSGGCGPDTSGLPFVTLNNLFWLLLKPSQLILVVALLALLLWRRRAGRVLGAVTAGLVVIFGLLPLAALLIKPLETRYPIPAASAPADGVIVLAGAEHVTLSEAFGQPQIGSMGDRLTTFLVLAQRYPRARLVHSGAYEAEVARELLVGAGVPSERIEFEDRSRNTCESARATRELVQPSPDERWLLVTSAFHLPRAMACFRAVGWEVVPYPTDFRRGRSVWHLGIVENLEDLDLAAHEWLGLLYYRLGGRTRELVPPREGAPGQ